ncbi:MAG: HAD family hydrolase [Planctomycetota bacterium]|nr:HAD family hydrolase [Planctomycetota bacterium]
MRAVVFDLFGTLVPNLDPSHYVGRVSRIAAELGVPEEPFLNQWRTTFRARMDGTLIDGPDMYIPILDALGIAWERQQLVDADVIRSSMIQDGLAPKPDAVATLRELQDAGYLLALATDCSSGTPDLLDNTPLGRFFTVRAVSAHLKTTKPDARMYRHVLDGLGVTGEECLYVGDGNSRELIGAREHGMTTVWVDNGNAQQWEHEFVPDGDHTIRDLAEIPALLRSL